MAIICIRMRLSEHIIGAVTADQISLTTKPLLQLEHCWSAPENDLECRVLIWWNNAHSST